jgi:hypothetical protein
MSRLLLLATGVFVSVGLSCPSPLSGQEAGKGLRLAWEFATPKEFPMGMVADGAGRPYLHVAMKNGGLLVLDVANRAGPKVAARIGLESFANLQVMNLTQRGEYLYLALGEFFDARAGAPAGLAVVDVKNPQQPKVLGVWKSKETVRGSAAVLVDRNHAYLAAMSEGVMIFDVSRPDQIEPIATYQPDVHFPRKDPPRVHHPNARGLAIQGNLLYVAYDAGGLRILDITDRKRPREIGRHVNQAMGKKPQAYNSVVVDGNLAYLPCDYAGLEIVDVRNPNDIRPVGWWNPWEAHTLKNVWLNSPGHTNQIFLDARKKLAYLSAGASELQVVDVSTPARPRLAASYREPGADRGVWGLAATKDRVYLGYITSLIPFKGTWAGIKAVER